MTLGGRRIHQQATQSRELALYHPWLGHAPSRGSVLRQQGARDSLRRFMSKKLAPSLLILLTLGVSLPGCEVAGFGKLTNAQCLKEEETQARDSCYFDLVAESAENNDIQTCMQEVVMIQDPLLRAAAVRMMISRQPQGMDSVTATNLCQQLSDDEAEDCQRAWDRPHLWRTP